MALVPSAPAAGDDAPAPAAEPAAPRPGRPFQTPLPDITLADRDGKPTKLGEFRRAGR